MQFLQLLIQNSLFINSAETASNLKPSALKSWLCKTVASCHTGLLSCPSLPSALNSFEGHQLCPF